MALIDLFISDLDVIIASAQVHKGGLLALPVERGWDYVNISSSLFNANVRAISFSFTDISKQKITAPA